MGYYILNKSKNDNWTESINMIEEHMIISLSICEIQN